MEGKDGNKKRIVPGKFWVFTLNNYNQGHINTLLLLLNSHEYTFQEEIGENKTPHLQGAVCFTKKIRPSEYIGIKEIHWEKMKGTVEQAHEYCRKPESNNGGLWTNHAFIRSGLEGHNLFWWQQEIINIVKTEPDMRTIYWYWSEKGNTGKSTLCRHLKLHHQAVELDGTCKDALFIIQQKIKKKEPTKTIIFDIPRCNKVVNYRLLEKIKNGSFTSTKYEGSDIIIPWPHVIILANRPPDMLELSEDRWVIKNIDKSGPVASPGSSIVNGLGAGSLMGCVTAPPLTHTGI